MKFSSGFRLETGDNIVCWGLLRLPKPVNISSSEKFSFSCPEDQRIAYFVPECGNSVRFSYGETRQPISEV